MPLQGLLFPEVVYLSKLYDCCVSFYQCACFKDERGGHMMAKQTSAQCELTIPLYRENRAMSGLDYKGMYISSRCKERGHT